MRLDEWQKFIESQFLEDNAANAATQETAVVTAPDAEPETAAAQIPDTADEPPAPEIVTAPDVPKDAPAIPLHFDDAENIAPPAVPAVTKVPDETHYRSFEAALDFDTEIPSFEKYMPAFRTAPSGTSQAKPISDEARPPRTANREPTAEAAEAVVLREEQTLAPVVSGLFDAAPEESAFAEISVTVQTETRASRPRARHARNVRPDNVLSGLSAAELFASAPRHLQTLLALERLQEEEIAQSSYKRPFAVGRRELIERLLDPVLSLEDTARLLGVCPTTVRRYTNRGILTHYRKEPERTTLISGETGKETRQRRFRLSDILAFLETQQAAVEADRLAEKNRAERKISDTQNAVPSP